MPPRNGFEPAGGGMGWGGPGCGRRGCGRGAGGGRGRLFDNGDLRLLILGLLADRPRHGYEVIKALEERVGGGYSPSPGVVYPTLTLLQELGQAEVQEDHAGRKLYALTADGQAALAEAQPVLEAIQARLDAGAAQRGGPPPQLARALENLAAALRLRLQAQTPSAAQIRAMAAAIDATAQAIAEVEPD